MKTFKFIVVTEYIQHGEDMADAANRLRHNYTCLRSTANRNLEPRHIDTDGTITTIVKSDIIDAQEIPEPEFKRRRVELPPRA